METATTIVHYVHYGSYGVFTSREVVGGTGTLTTNGKFIYFSYFLPKYFEIALFK